VKLHRLEECHTPYNKELKFSSGDHHHHHHHHHHHPTNDIINGCFSFTVSKAHGGQEG
jgi:hypothetical protein